jgi:hypothetical protein
LRKIAILKAFFKFIVTVFLTGGPLVSAIVHASPDQISGTIVQRGPSCPRLKLDDGRTISLMGLAASTLVGTKLRLEGHWIKRSNCQQGPAFQVLKHVIKK